MGPQEGHLAGSLTLDSFLACKTVGSLTIHRSKLNCTWSMPNEHRRFSRNPGQAKIKENPKNVGILVILVMYIKTS